MPNEILILHLLKEILKLVGGDIDSVAPPPANAKSVDRVTSGQPAIWLALFLGLFLGVFLTLLIIGAM